MCVTAVAARSRPRSHRLFVLSLLAVLTWSAAHADSFAVDSSPPRVGLYGSILGDWRPFVLPDGSLDTVNLARVARFHEVVLDAYPITPYRPDVVAALRQRHPDLIVYGYVLADHIWATGDADSMRQIPTVIRRTVRDLDGFLYDRLTGREYDPTNINLAKRVNGRYVVAEAMADVMIRHIQATGIFDGLFVDVYCHTVSWTENGTPNRIDVTRAGYPDLASLDAAWAEASDTLAALLRRDARDGGLLVGNCGPSEEHAWFNGWMSENFPYQQAGNWIGNMLGDRNTQGYLRDDEHYVPNAHNWLLVFADLTPGATYGEINTRRVRNGLASAALGDGVFAFGPTNKSLREAPYHEWWYDEYAVDLTTARASEELRHTGWLGAPLGEAQQVIALPATTDAITDPGFESALGSGWAFNLCSPAVATVERDSTTRAVGQWSARVCVTQPGLSGWQADLYSRTNLAMQAGVPVSATFWCRASADGLLEVAATPSGAEGWIVVDTTWRRYQVVMTPTATVSAPLELRCGGRAATFWFDDVHFQTGQSSYWRRDFVNGIVLVNPTSSRFTLRLESPYRRVVGVHETTINNGTLSRSQTLEPFDAMFLLRNLDVTSPTVAVTAPASNAVWTVGTPATIRWTATDDMTITGVDLLLSTTGTEPYRTTIASAVANTGTYTWTVAAASTRKARVKVVVRDGWNHTTTRTSGLFSIRGGAIADEATLETPSFELALAPITPNPARGALRIAFTLPREQTLRLSVLDVQGRECAVLADGVHRAGPHEVAAQDGSRPELSPGLYWLRLRTEDGTRTSRFVLMR